MLTGQQMSQGFLGSGPGSNSVLLPGKRKKGHEPGPRSVLHCTSIYAAQGFITQISIVQPVPTELFMNVSIEQTPNQKAGE